MKSYKLEAVVVSFFVLLVFLASIGISYMKLTALIAAPFIIGILIFVHVRNESLKEEIMLLLLSVLYKSFFVISLCFALGNYPGRDLLFGISLLFALLIISLSYFKNRNSDFIVVAILYINFLGGLAAVLPR